MVAFDTTATRIEFPFAGQAARLTRCIDSRRKPAAQIETDDLITSWPTAQVTAEQMRREDRRYWGIETGLHPRLDVIAGEDRSRALYCPRKPFANATARFTSKSSMLVRNGPYKP